MKVSETSRIRTGFEELVAHRTRPPFAFPAEEDGIILDVNESLKTMTIKYKSGKKVCVRYGEEYSNNTSNGFFVNQDVVLNWFKRGDKFKKDDILTYNREFFQADPYSKSTVRYKLGVQAHVAILDNGGTIEDASILTQPLCEKMEFYPVHQVDVVITPDTNVRSFAKIGDFINSIEPIMVFDESAFEVEAGADAEYIDMLSKLNTTSKRAGHTGTIVKIEALYACPISQMTPSLQKLVKYAVAERDKQADYAKGCENSSEFVKSVPLPSTMGKEAKVGLVEITQDVVMIRFYIKQIKGMSPGDKLFFGPSLKSVCSQVYPESIEVEDGSVKVDAATSGRGILQRIISSPFITGLGNAVLEKAEQDILKMWDEN